MITIGGKGSSLTPAALHSISHSLSLLRIDSSSLDRLSNQTSTSITEFHRPRNLLSPPESRAFLVTLLNKLLLYPYVRTALPLAISDHVNLKTEARKFFDVTEEESVLLESLSLPSLLCGICGILDYESSGLCVVSDVVAALSCEASGADVAGFGTVDSGDGFSAKEEIGVAGDLKVLLNGSKLVGKRKIDDVMEIVKINGKLREVVKALHLSVRIELNSNSRGSGVLKGLGANVVALAAAVKNLGESSLRRAELSLDSSGLRGLFTNDCPSRDSLRGVYKSVLEAHLDEDWVRFGQQANVLVGVVWKIVSWEAVVAFVAIEKMSGGGGGDVEGDKKSEKKKKKVVLGKGSGVVVQLIKDRLQSKGDLGVLEKLVEGFFSILDPKNPDFDGFLTKVKEIVESNESRRLPKLPKVIIYLHKYWLLPFSAEFRHAIHLLM